jgi:hypothetical protein
MPESSNGSPVGSGFTEGELQFASFWVRNKVAIRKAIYAFLIVINAIFWGYAAWGFIDGYALSGPRESRIPQEIAANEIISRQLTSSRPQSVQVSPVDVFQNTDNRLDLLVPVANPNTQWMAEFTYRFNVSGELTPARSGFLLPGEKTYLGEFGFSQKTPGARTGALTVDNLKWRRLDPNMVGSDYASWVARRSAFQISDIKQSSTVAIGGKSVLRTSFTFSNPTAYGYWNVDLYVVLKRGDVPVAANKITLSNVASGETRPVALDWFEQLPQVTDTEVVPVVNYLDSSAYMPAAK